MKRVAYFLMIPAMLASTLFAEHQRYSIEPNPSSRLELRVFKTGLYRGKVHTFVFPAYRAVLLYDADRPEASHIELSISADAIQCMDTWLKPKDLKSVQEYAVKDMLAAERFPEILFTSSEIRGAGAGRFEVRGMLTLRGIAKPSIINVTLQQDSGTPVFRGTSVVRLTDYGLKPPKAALGTIGTKDEMEFSFTLHAAPLS